MKITDEQIKYICEHIMGYRYDHHQRNTKYSDISGSDDDVNPQIYVWSESIAESSFKIDEVTYEVKKRNYDLTTKLEQSIIQISESLMRQGGLEYSNKDAVKDALNSIEERKRINREVKLYLLCGKEGK